MPPFSPAAASAKLAEMREWCEANMHNADAAYVARRVPELKAELRAELDAACNQRCALAVAEAEARTERTLVESHAAQLKDQQAALQREIDELAADDADDAAKIKHLELRLQMDLYVYGIACQMILREGSFPFYYTDANTG